MRSVASMSATILLAAPAAADDPPQVSLQEVVRTASMHAAPAEEPEGPQSPTFSGAASASGEWPWQASTLTGDWGGLRTHLSDSGVVLNATATLDLATVMGNAPQRGFVMPYLIDVNLSLDTARMGLWQGGQAFVDFQQAGSTKPATNFVPDYWGWDAIYPFQHDYTELAQYWYQQAFADNAIRLKLGKIDANVDFAVSYPNLLFVNSAAYMPSVLAADLPTYPNQAGGFEVLTRPLEWLDAKFGMFDGSTNWYDPSTGTAGSPSGGRGLGGFLWSNPGSYFLIGEGNVRWDQAPLPGHWNVGWFQQTGASAESSLSQQASPPADVPGAWGLYTSFSQAIWRPEGATDGRGLSAFGQFGWSTPSSNPSQWSLMGGGTWLGLLPERPGDTAGLLVAYAHLSNQPALGPSAGEGEFVVEGFYNVQVTPWLGIQPDLQFINQPSTIASQDIGGAWIFTARVSISF